MSRVPLASRRKPRVIQLSLLGNILDSLDQQLKVEFPMHDTRAFVRWSMALGKIIITLSNVTLFNLHYLYIDTHIFIYRIYVFKSKCKMMCFPMEFFKPSISV